MEPAIKSENANLARQSVTQSKDGSWLETVAAWISGIMIFAVAGLLVSQAVRKPAPPNLVVEQGDVRELDGQYYLTVNLKNTGDEAAQHVEVEAEVVDKEASVTEGKATIDWSPGRSRQKGTMIFDVDPRGKQVKLRVVGYAEP